MSKMDTTEWKNKVETSKKKYEDNIKKNVQL